MAIWQAKSKDGSIIYYYGGKPNKETIRIDDLYKYSIKKVEDKKK